MVNWQPESNPGLWHPIFMADNRQNNQHRRFWRLLPILLLPIITTLRVTASTSLEGRLQNGETRQRLEQIEQRRQELHNQAVQARKKEQIALVHLHEIQSKLNATTGVLNQHKKNLERTDSKITETQHSLETTHTATESLSSQAAARLREIFEGQRVSLIEMLFQVDSLQALLDRAYYQERIAEMDRALLLELRAKADVSGAKEKPAR